VKSNEDAFESIDINDSDDFENDEHKSSSFKRIKDATAKIGSMFDGFRQKTNSIQRLRNLKQEDKCNQSKEAKTKIPAGKPGKAPTNLEDKKSNRNENSKNTDSNAEMIKILANKAVNGAKEVFHMPWNYQAQETANKNEETKKKNSTVKQEPNNKKWSSYLKPKRDLKTKPNQWFTIKRDNYFTGKNSERSSFVNGNKDVWIRGTVSSGALISENQSHPLKNNTLSKIKSTMSLETVKKHFTQSYQQKTSEGNAHFSGNKDAKKHNEAKDLPQMKHSISNAIQKYGNIIENIKKYANIASNVERTENNEGKSESKHIKILNNKEAVEQHKGVHEIKKFKTIKVCKGDAKTNPLPQIAKNTNNKNRSIEGCNGKATKVNKKQ